MKKHNFYAGPSIMSQYTIKNTADAVLDFATPACRFSKSHTVQRSSRL